MTTTPATLEDVLLHLADQWQLLGLAMVVITLASLLICYLLLKAERPLTAHRFMALPVLLTVLPGIFYSVILAYLLVFARANLISLPIFTFLPPLWMGISLYLYSQLVNFEHVPGFSRLSGLALFVGVVFAAAFILARLRIIAVFWLSPKWLFPLVLVLYFGWRTAVRRMFARE